MVRATDRIRLDSLTGIRAIAAVLVFWHHASEYYGSPSSGMVGVSLFYLLSGFVMAWTDRPGDTAKAFYQRRFARIYPAYLVAFATAVTFKYFHEGLGRTDIVPVTMMQSWFPTPVIYFAASTVFWSLSVEAFFYIVFPLLRKITTRLQARGLWGLATGAVVASFTVGVVGSTYPVSNTVQWAVVVFPPARLPEFIIGAVLGALIARGWRPRVNIWIALGLSAIATGVAIWSPYALSRYVITLLPFSALVVALALSDLAHKRTFLTSRVFVMLGNWSYAFYLLHLTVLIAVVEVIAPLAPLTVSIAFAFIGSLLAAWALHMLIELPGQRALRSWFSRRRTRQV